MIKLLKASRGFTLIEILISMTIFSLMAVLFLNVFFGSFLISQRAEARTSTISEVAGSIESNISETAPVGTPASVTLNYSSGVESTPTGIVITKTITNVENQTITFKYFKPEEN